MLKRSKNNPKIECAYDELVDPATLRPNPRNPNKHPKDQIALLVKIINHQGWRNPIVVSNRSGFVTKGHARLEAALLIGCSEVPVDFQDYKTDKDEVADMIADNRIAELAEPDLPGLKDLLEELDTGEFDMDLTGFDTKALEDLMTQTFELRTGKTEDDALPENVETRCKRGDIWQMGSHRLMCGDATKVKDVLKLMGDERAAMIFTDPPWNVAISQDSNPRHRQRSGLQNDALSQVDFETFLSDSIESWQKVCAGDVYCILGASEWPTLDLILRKHGFHWSATIIWVKDIFVLGRSKYHRRYEPIWYGWHAKAKSSFGESRDKDDVWEIPRPKRSEEHPTMKPVDLICRAIENSSGVKGIVLDPFLGSGSTTIACEKLGRKCYGMEIDPHYCDVVIRRWEDFTGKTAGKL